MTKPTKIDIHWLRRHCTCRPGREWFYETYGDKSVSVETVVRRLYTDRPIGGAIVSFWAPWLMCNVLPYPTWMAWRHERGHSATDDENRRLNLRYARKYSREKLK